MRKSDKDASRIMWSLIGIVDCCLNQKVLPQEITVTVLTGKGKGNKGYPYPNVAEANQTLPAQFRLHLDGTFWSLVDTCQPAKQAADQPANQPWPYATVCWTCS